MEKYKDALLVVLQSGIFDNMKDFEKLYNKYKKEYIQDNYDCNDIHLSKDDLLEVFVEFINGEL